MRIAKHLAALLAGLLLYGAGPSQAMASTPSSTDFYVDGGPWLLDAPVNTDIGATITIYDENGQPMPNVAVYATDIYGGDANLVISPANLVTGANGTVRCTIRATAVAEYDVVAVPVGMNWWDLPINDSDIYFVNWLKFVKVTGDDDQTTDLTTGMLNGAPTIRHIIATAYDAFDQPMPGVDVTVTISGSGSSTVGTSSAGPWNSSATATTDASGTANFWVNATGTGTNSIGATAEIPWTTPGPNGWPVTIQTLKVVSGYLTVNFTVAGVGGPSGSRDVQCGNGYWTDFDSEWGFTTVGANSNACEQIYDPVSTQVQGEWTVSLTHTATWHADTSSGSEIPSNVFYELACAASASVEPGTPYLSQGTASVASTLISVDPNFAPDPANTRVVAASASSNGGVLEIDQGVDGWPGPVTSESQLFRSVRNFRSENQGASQNSYFVFTVQGSTYTAPMLVGGSGAYVIGTGSINVMDLTPDPFVK